jgi:hypothetical protein
MGRDNHKLQSERDRPCRHPGDIGIAIADRRAARICVAICDPMGHIRDMSTARSTRNRSNVVQKRSPGIAELPRLDRWPTTGSDRKFVASSRIRLTSMEKGDIAPLRASFLQATPFRAPFRLACPSQSPSRSRQENHLSVHECPRGSLINRTAAIPMDIVGYIYI